MSINRTRWLDKLRPAGASSGGWTEGVLNFAIAQSTPPSANLATLRNFGLQNPVCCFGGSLIIMEYKELRVLQHVEDSKERLLLLWIQGAYTVVRLLS